jgi:hypothetical protein
MFKQVVLTLNIVFQKVNIQFTIILPFIPRFQNAFLISSLPSYIFFFFYWLYNPLWGLVFPSDFLPFCSFFTFTILHIIYKFLFFPSCVLHGLLVIVDFIMLPLLLSTLRLLVLIFRNTFYHIVASHCSRDFALNNPVFRRTSGWNLI